MKTIRLLLITIVFLTASLSTAQDGDIPLLIRTESGYVSWSNGEITRPACPPGVLSPDGRFVVTSTVPEFFSEGLKRAGGIGGAAFANDLNLCKIASGETVALTEQPPDAALFMEGVPDRWISRSAAAWSPDGLALAWTESDYPVPEDNTVRLIVYSLEGGQKIAEVSGIPGPQMPSPLDVQWGAGGIALLTMQFDPATTLFYDIFQIYSMDGRLMKAFDVTLPNDYLVSWLWVDDGGQPKFATLYDQAGWYVADPNTGISEPMNGLPQLISVVNPEESSSLLLLDIQGGFIFQVMDRAHNILTGGDAQPVTFTLSGPDQVAISPAGDVAIIYDDHVQVFQSGYFDTLFNTGGLVEQASGVQWGPTLWRIWTGEAAVQTPANCPGLPPSFLTVGGQGREITDSPNNVRADPSTSAGIVGQIPGYGTFTVLDGPACADGIAWWLVDVDGLVGWTAEGKGKEYWLEPVP